MKIELKIKDGNKTEEIEEEGDADDQCSADMLLKAVIITVWWLGTSLDILIFFSQGLR